MGKTKTSKHRGKRTHGRGKKSGRGAGKRGGKGMAGTHKHRFMWVLKHDKERYFGMHGFKRPQKVSKALITVNVSDLERFKESEHVKVQKDRKVVDLAALGIDKLLGGGNANMRYEVKVAAASAKAVEKVEGAGGKVNIVTVNKKDINEGADK